MDYQIKRFKFSMKYISVLGFLFMFVLSCTGPLPKVYSPGTFEMDCLELKEFLNRDEYKLLVNYIKDNKDKLSTVSNMSYGNLLTIAKEEENAKIQEISKLADELESINKMNRKPGSVITNGETDQTGEISEVSIILKEFSRLISSGNTRKLKKMYSRSYRSGFEEYVEMAKKITKEEIYALTIMDGVNIIKIKNEFDLDELTDMNIDELYGIFLEKDVILIREDPLLEDPTNIGENKISGYFNMGGDFRKQVIFEKEGNIWKINLWDSEEEKIRRGEEIINRFGIDKKQFFDGLLSNIEFKK